jgi:PIN domain nuclease of toxin-antitoxin system
MSGAVYVLDACALIAVLNGEPGAEIVKPLLDACEAHEITIHMSAVQVLEVYYDRIYMGGQKLADEFLATFYKSGVIIDPYTELDISQAGHYKTSYDLSLADAICLATASNYAAIVITSDYEFDPVEKSEHLSFLWTRPKPKSDT